MAKILNLFHYDGGLGISFILLILSDSDPTPFSDIRITKNRILDFVYCVLLYTLTDGRERTGNQRNQMIGN